VSWHPIPEGPCPINIKQFLRQVTLIPRQERIAYILSDFYLKVGKNAVGSFYMLNIFCRAYNGNNTSF
jgi:hypothetical protein